MNAGSRTIDGKLNNIAVGKGCGRAIMCHMFVVKNTIVAKEQLTASRAPQPKLNGVFACSCNIYLQI